MIHGVVNLRREATLSLPRMEIMDFKKLLVDRGICIHDDVEDFEQDVQHLRDRGDGFTIN